MCKAYTELFSSISRNKVFDRFYQNRHPKIQSASGIVNFIEQDIIATCSKGNTYIVVFVTHAVICCLCSIYNGKRIQIK